MVVVGVGRLALNGTEIETKSVQFRVGLCVGIWCCGFLLTQWAGGRSGQVGSR